MVYTKEEVLRKVSNKLDSFKEDMAISKTLVLSVIDTVLDYENKPILEEAADIVYRDSREKQQEYGSFDEIMSSMAVIATALTDKPMSVETCYMTLVALKFARQKHLHKRDNLLDAVAYLGAYEKYMSAKESVVRVNESLNNTKNKV